MEVLLKGIRRLGFNLEEDQILLFKRYIQELADWNKRTNLTAITGNRDVQVNHFLDSLTVSLAIPEDVMANGTLMDVGSGGGFPGLPLKILWPGLRVTLVESVGKRATFLRHMTDTLGLQGTEVICQRAETLAHDPHLRETFDVVVSRAVAGLRALAELTLPFCKLGGRTVAMKKSDIGDELKGSERAVSILGGALERIEVVDLEEIGEPRWLVVLTKDAISPSRYPRRPGIPAKRPL
ncbi:16S rRNA (guanine(527)-N(7))-methyltransferase RsmG [SAR202 cluster bacterium AC-647-N09_OGT_505m]|nr:16S rRNA (guanine(527)-N(7))-methyltransferase RsmG [SAR202 cluster bacterium AC-647-N09_OGT_505m]